MTFKIQGVSLGFVDDLTVGDQLVDNRTDDVITVTDVVAPDDPHYDDDPMSYSYHFDKLDKSLSGAGLHSKLNTGKISPKDQDN